MPETNAPKTYLRTSNQRFPGNRSGVCGQFMILHSPLTGRTPRVVECSLTAWRCGVRIGMPLAEARALAAVSSNRSRYQKRTPDPFFAVHDPAADRAALRELSSCCEKYTPIYGVEDVESPQCLLLDVTGCLALFGSEQSLAEQIHEDFQDRGWEVRVAMAPTIGAAWAVAHGVSRANQAVVVPAEGLEETLDALPVRMLRLPDATVHTLSELGIHGVGQLRQLPRDRLPSRFGPLILQRLDQAFGNAPELIVVERLAEPMVATWAAQEPFRDRQVLLEVCRRLLERLLAPLQGQRRGARRLLCQLHGVSRPRELSIGMVSPNNSPGQMLKLLELQLERVTWEDEITFVRLEATEVAPLEERIRDLFGEQFGEDHTRELRWLLERLSNRLGAEAVVRATCVPDPQPELAVNYQAFVDLGFFPGDFGFAKEESPCLSSNPKSPNPKSPGKNRPLRLFTPPQRVELVFTAGVLHRFFWNHTPHDVRQVWGPERIETGWWRGNHVQRDYYQVELTSGERYWLFRTNENWFVHGTFE